MDEAQAALIAEGWPGGRGLVPRGPRWLLGFAPVDRAEAHRRCGAQVRGEVWRVDVGGRFLRAGGLVYPGGVPFPEDLARTTAVISSEVWLYVEADGGRVVGVYAWPEAVRKPIASVPRADVPAFAVCHPDDAGRLLDFPLALPDHPGYRPALLLTTSPDAATVFCVADTVPDPVNEMLLYEQRGLSLRAEAGVPTDLEAVLREHQPPFRRAGVGRLPAAGREPGRTLGPQTWPWPAELIWEAEGVRYALKGFAALNTLVEVAQTLTVSPAR